MRTIETSIYSQMSFDENKRFTQKAVRASEPIVVKTYSELVSRVAYISHYNKDFTLFYRGQKTDYARPGGESTFFPSIYRGVLRKTTLYDRFRRLERATNLLEDYFRVSRLPGMKNILKMEELCWAILQHYEVCPTPLLDLTHSLRVASSFAQLDNASSHGYVYVFGLPYTTNRISYNLENDLVNMRLLNICPPMVLRPYFQDAYLIGSFPFVRVPEDKNKLDFNRRLIAKFKIPTTGFWTDNFKAIPADYLFPEEKELNEVFREIRYNIE